MLVAGCILRLQDCGFLASGVCPLVGEVGLEARTGFLEGKASAYSLVGGLRSWPSGRQCLEACLKVAVGSGSL